MKENIDMKHFWQQSIEWDKVRIKNDEEQIKFHRKMIREANKSIELAERWIEELSKGER